MGTKIQDIVVVNTDLNAKNSAGKDLNTAMIFDEVTQFGTRYQTYTSTTEMKEAGFAITDTAYIMANNHFSQENKPSTVVVGRKLKDQNTIQVVTFDADATTGSFTLIYDSATTTAIAYNAPAADVKSAIESIAAITEVTVTLNTGATQAGDKEGFTIEFTGADANTDFDAFTGNISALTSVSTITINKTHFGSTAETWSTGYDAVKAAYSGFYMVHPSTTTDADILALAANCEADGENRVMFFQTDASAVLTSTASITYQLKTAGYNRSTINYHAASGEYANAANSGYCLPKTPGSINWCNNDLVGITGGTFTSTQLGVLTDSYCGWVESIKNFTIFPGTTAGKEGAQNMLTSAGLPVDLIHGADNITAKIQEALLSFLVANDKVAWTAADFAAIKGIILGNLQTYGVDANYLVEGTTFCNMPAIDYSATDKQNRSLKQIECGGTYASAVDKITIQLNFSY